MRPADCHPDRPYYALNQCEQCYRKQHYNAAYIKERWGDRLPGYRARYEGSVKGQQRRERYLRVRAAVATLLGVTEPRLTQVFSSPTELQQLQAALRHGDPRLAEIWSDLSPEQQSLLQPTPQAWLR